ncbi:MAG: 30S ribosomal protein S8e [Candidatus ainarchaeum sp.]|nr:30S ribosomal protein S8e [Candidatus ainarchaeum sp.]
MLSNEKSRRKPTGGINHTIRRKKKKLSELRNNASNPIITQTEEKRKVLRVKSGMTKTAPLKLKFVNVKLKTGKIVKGQMVTEKVNKAHKEFVRRNILTKGAEVEVKIGEKTMMVKVTSRPGQTGIVNAVEM